MLRNLTVGRRRGSKQRRQRAELKEQRDLERQKPKMETAELRKAEKVVRWVQREQEESRRKEQSSSSPNMPIPSEHEESITEPSVVAGGKRRLDVDAGSSHGGDRKSTRLNSSHSSPSRMPSSA